MSAPEQISANSEPLLWKIRWLSFLAFCGMHLLNLDAAQAEEDAPPVVSLSMNSQYALEGHYLNYGLVTLSRTGSANDPLTVAIGTEGNAVRETDYWLELDPCGGCTRPRVHIMGGEVTIPPESSSITIGFNATFEFNPPIGFSESVLENAILRLLPNSHYDLGAVSETEVFIVNQEEANNATLTIIEPVDLATFSQGAGIPIKLLSVEPGGFIFDAEVFANGRRIGHASSCAPNAFCGPPEEGSMGELLFYPDANQSLEGIWRDVASGEYTIEAQSVLFDGQVIKSNTVRVTVKTPTNNAELLATQLPDRTIRLDLLSPASDQQYTVETSDDLVQWKKLGEFAPNGSFFDEGAGSLLMRYYRASPQ